MKKLIELPNYLKKLNDNHMTKTQIINGKVLLPSGLKKVNIEFENGIITKISSKLSRDKSASILEANGKYVLPGFIDIHTNGILGFDLTSGLYDVDRKIFLKDEENYLSGLDRSLKEFAKHGVTLVAYSTLEAPKNELKKVFKFIARYKNKSNSPYKDIFHGIYMEGTFMKDKKFRGAHNPKYFNEPSISLFDEFQKAADGNIKIVNVVPEWDKSALELIKYLKSKKIICAAGHTSASGNQYRRAIQNGLSLAIHVLNGPSSTSFKPFESGGALESILKSEEIFVEIIPDGYHVDKSYVLDIIKRKGFEKCIAISDSMFLTKMRRVKEFEINKIIGKLSKNGEYIQLAGKGNENSLFGSVLTMDKAFANLLTWFTNSIEGIWNRKHNPIEFEKALLLASNMCSANPAKLLGIYDSGNRKVPIHCTGSIEIGKYADLVISDIGKRNTEYELLIENVFFRGNVTSQM